MDASSVVLLFSSVILFHVQVSSGEYDSLQKAAEKTFPSRISFLENTLVDRGIFSEFMFHALSYYAPTDSTNTKCANHSIRYQEAFLKTQLWALSMMDSSTTLSPGILTGNLQGLGSFDECLSVEDPARQFTGQLCVVQTSGILPPVVSNRATSQFSLIPALTLDLSLSVCVPSSCSPEDVATHWQTVAAEFNASASVSATDCSVRGDAPPSNYTWAALVVLVALFLLVVASTCYDYRVGHQPDKERRILLCFSVYTNMGKLFNTQRQSGSLDILDGIRVLAISWIVLGHRFEISLLVPNFTLIAMEKYTTAWFMSPVLNMMLAVELFFLLSGCLLAYHFLKDSEKGKTFNLAHFYYKRYLRLTPTLAVVMMLEACVLLHVSDGPLWKRLVGGRVDSCQNFWWTNLLYISNYVNPYRTCLLQTWYLSVDMQLYLVSPLLLFALTRSPRRGLILLAVCYTATTAAAFFNALNLQLPSGSPATLDKKTEHNHGSEYVVTHVRAASWLTGIALGYVLHMSRKNPNAWKLSTPAARLGWVVSATMCLAAVYSITPFQSTQHVYSRLWDSLHIALHRNIFSLGAAGIIFLFVTIKGCGGWNGLRPLATLSYGVYLCHMSLQTVSLARLRQPLFFDMFTLFTSLLSDLLLANLMAFLLYLFVEAPFCELGRWIYNTDEELKSMTEKPLPDHINLEDNKSSL